MSKITKWKRKKRGIKKRTKKNKKDPNRIVIALGRLKVKNQKREWIGWDEEEKKNWRSCGKREGKKGFFYEEKIFCFVM